ncbi:hypothetical protein LC607_35390 [Nostoc sp. CHAB 5824]|nr:hypothetical protein [Nostoc sp. CHAB 5824]
MLTAQRNTLALNIEEVFVDVIEFDAAVRRSDLKSLKNAASLYTGPLLAECTEGWVLEEREARQESYRGVLESLAAYTRAAGDYAGAEKSLRSALDIDPIREGNIRDLMEVLALQQEYTVAEYICRDFIYRLSQEDPPQSPSPETVALSARLQTEARIKAKVGTVATSDDSIIPLSSELPCPLTALVGREENVIEVIARLRLSRLVTLTGTGGVGKTRLALAAAERIGKEQVQRIKFTDLSKVTEKTLINQAVAEVFKIREQAGKSLETALLDFLKLQTLTLVMDNCEHLLEDCATFVARLLRDCPKLRVLATSRQPLGIMGETVWRVPSLTVPSAIKSPVEAANRLEEFVKYSAVQLFVTRAEATSKGFHLTVENCAAVADICLRLGGIPLALELAAARLSDRTVEEIADSLNNRFRLLTKGDRTALTRHQTLRASVDWSYQFLTLSEKTLFQRLSVFTGGWTLEAAEAICSEGLLENDTALDLLAALVDKSLLYAGESGGKTRYGQLETIQQYGQEHLAEVGEERQVRNRHLLYYVEMAEQAENDLDGVEQASCMQRLVAEHGNLRTALAWCDTSADNTEAGLRLAAALKTFWYRRGLWSEGRDYLERNLAQEKGLSSAKVYTKALIATGHLAANQGDYQGALLHLTKAITLSKDNGDKRSLAEALCRLGNATSEQNDWRKGQLLCQEALEIFRELKDSRGEVMALFYLGSAYFDGMDYLTAWSFSEQAITLARQMQNEHLTAFLLVPLGNIARFLGDIAASRSFHEQNLNIQRTLQEPIGIVYSLEALAAIAATLRHPLHAAQLFGAAEHFRENLSFPVSPNGQEDYARTIENIKAILGQETFLDARAKGYAMDIEQAIRSALEYQM